MLTAHVQRRGNDRGHAHFPAGLEAFAGGCLELRLQQVLDQYGLALGYRYGAQMTPGICDMLADLRPASTRRLPAPGVHLDLADEPFLGPHVDETVVSELRNEGVGDAAECLVELE